MLSFQQQHSKQLLDTIFMMKRLDNLFNSWLNNFTYFQQHNLNCTIIAFLERLTIQLVGNIYYYQHQSDIFHKQHYSLQSFHQHLIIFFNLFDNYYNEKVTIISAPSSESRNSCPRSLRTPSLVIRVFIKTTIFLA